MAIRDAEIAEELLAAARAGTTLQNAARDMYEALKALGDEGITTATELGLVGLSHSLAEITDNLRRRGESGKQGGWPPPMRR